MKLFPASFPRVFFMGPSQHAHVANSTTRPGAYQTNETYGQSVILPSPSSTDSVVAHGGGVLGDDEDDV